MIGWPPFQDHFMSDCLKRWVTSVLQAASVTPLPMGRPRESKEGLSRLVGPLCGNPSRHSTHSSVRPRSDGSGRVND